MSIQPSAHAEWLSRHLQTTVSANARRAGVDLDNLRKACRGVPQQFNSERMERVYEAHGLTRAQFDWNVKVGWHWKKSFAPRKRPGLAHELSINMDTRSAADSGQSNWCRPDLCRLAGRCAACKGGDFSGRLPKACLDPRAYKPAMPRVRVHRGSARAAIRREMRRRK